MENKEKIKFRFNLIDAVLVAVILAAAVLLVYIFSSSSVSLFGGKSSVDIIYTVELRKIREEFRSEDLIKVGDSVTDSVTLYAIGEVVEEAVYEPFMYKGVDSEGKVKTEKYPDFMNITLTIRASADTSEGIYSIGGYSMAVGKKVSLRVPNFTGEGYCTSIREVND